MQKFRRIVRKRKTELTAACLLLLLSLAMAFAGSWFYRQYRKQVIQTEKSQLLTMAGIIGNNLNTYLDEQLQQIDLFYAQEADSENNMPPEDIQTRTAYFLKENGGLYNWITVTEPDGTSLRYETGKEAVREQAEEAIQQGKISFRISPLGFLARQFPTRPAGMNFISGRRLLRRTESVY